MDSDGFQFVSKKKAARKRRPNNPDVAPSLPEDSVDDSIRKICEAKAILQSGQGHGTLINNLKNINNHAKNIIQDASKGRDQVYLIACYGVGSPSSSRIARYQTALLLILRDHFNVKVEVYDPVFTSVDTRVLTDLGLIVLTDNEEGKRTVNEVTIFYMPHCPKELYNNLLWANWDPRALAQCVVIGNSFNSIVLNTPTRILKSSYQFICETQTMCKEYPLKSLVKFDDIFNDLSIHLFLTSSSCNTWQKGNEPIYDDSGELVSAAEVS